MDPIIKEGPRKENWTEALPSLQMELGSKKEGKGRLKIEENVLSRTYILSGR